MELLNKISTLDARIRTCSILELTVKEHQKVNQNFLNSFQELMKI